MKRVVRKWFRNENLRNLTTNIIKDIQLVMSVQLYTCGILPLGKLELELERNLSRASFDGPLELPPPPCPIPSIPTLAQSCPALVQPQNMPSVISMLHQTRQWSMLLYLLLFLSLFLCFRALRKLLWNDLKFIQLPQHQLSPDTLGA